MYIWKIEDNYKIQKKKNNFLIKYNVNKRLD